MTLFFFTRHVFRYKSIIYQSIIAHTTSSFPTGAPVLAVPLVATPTTRDLCRTFATPYRLGIFSIYYYFPAPVSRLGSSHIRSAIRPTTYVLTNCDIIHVTSRPGADRQPAGCFRHPTGQRYQLHSTLSEVIPSLPALPEAKSQM